MGTMAVALFAAGTAVNSYAAYQQAQAQKNAAKYEAAIAQQNQRLASWQAQDARARGAIEEARYAREAGQLMGSQRAALAASGVDISSGSAADIQADTTRLADLDLAAIRANTEREAFGYQVEARDAQAASRLSRYGAQSIRPGLVAAGTLLGGSAQVADSWYRYKGR